MKTPLKEIIEATNTHNFDEVEKLLHQDAVYTFSGTEMKGLEKIRAYFEKTWSNIEDEEYWATDIQWLHDGEESKTCIYQYNYKGYVKGALVEGFGKATNVFVKCAEKNRWLLVHEHLSK